MTYRFQTLLSIASCATTQWCGWRTAQHPQHPTSTAAGQCRLTPGFRSAPHACFQRLRLKHDKLLSNFAFNCNVRHYTAAASPSSPSGCSSAASPPHPASMWWLNSNTPQPRGPARFYCTQGWCRGGLWRRRPASGPSPRREAGTLQRSLPQDNSNGYRGTQRQLDLSLLELT